MNPDRWQRIEQLYHAALERDAIERAAFLDAACAGNVDLRQEVESLLDHEADATRFLGAPAMEMAEQPLTDDPVERRAGQRLAHYPVVEQACPGGMGEGYS